jgi:hypothetical protein
VMFVVPETPTFGVHQLAFASALKSVVAWGDATAGAPHVVNVLGPTFSGTTPSLATALGQFPDGTLTKWSVRVISGTATSDTNKPMLDGVRRVSVTFAATVQPDSIIQKTANGYINLLVQGFLGVRGGGVRTAILSEYNTSYGYGREGDAHPDGLDPTLILSFPLHISRIRRDVPEAAPDPAAPPVVPRFRPLTLGDQARSTDQIPVFANDTTSSYGELMLANILGALKRERIEAVGILATDARDKLFLARQIAENVPNVLLFTTESDLLFAHPDYLSATRGMIVAAPYPLYAANQTWTAPFVAAGRRRHQFPTSSVEGSYNAAIALMNYDEQRRRTGGPASAILLDYTLPGHTCPAIDCGPPIWISVVGRDAPWPLTVESGGRSEYVFRPATDGTAASVTYPAVEAALHISTRVALSIVFGFAIAHAGLLFWPRSWFARRRRPSDRERMRYAAVALNCIALVCVFSAFITAASMNPADWSFTFFLMVLVTIGVVVLAAWASWQAWSLVRPRAAADADWPPAAQIVDHHPFQPTKRAIRIVKWAAAAAVFMWSVGNLVWYGWQRSDTLLHALVAERAATLANGVSPLVPVIVFASALYLWALVEVRRMARQRFLGSEEKAYLASLMVGESSGLRDGWALFVSSLTTLPAPFLAALGVLAAFLMFFVFDPFARPLLTFDGVEYGRFATAFVVLLHVIIAAALVQFLLLWQTMAQTLSRLAAHPIAHAYGGMPQRVFPQTVFPVEPKLLDLAVPVVHWRKLVNDPDADSPPRLHDADLHPLDILIDFEVEESPRAPWSESRTWKELVRQAASVRDALDRHWTERVVHAPKAVAHEAIGAALHTLPVGATVAAPLQTQAETRLTRQEEFVVMPVVLIVRAMLARLWDNLLFVTGAVALMMCGTLTYAFSQHQRLEALVWADILGAMSAVLYVVVSMERDEVLSRLSATTPGKISWDRDFVLKLIVYAIVPLLGLFATHFPSLGETLMHWLAPVQKALP